MDKFLKRTDSKVLTLTDLGIQPKTLDQEITELRKTVDGLILDVREIQAFLTDEQEDSIEEDNDWKPTQKNKKKPKTKKNLF